MKLLHMTASFGCLDQASLELQDGLNLFYAPNEGGKSTWCVFLLTMLYGFNTRARDKKAAPAEKNRYRPWSGAAMEGRLECLHQGKRIVLRRSSEHGSPMGTFSAVFAETGENVPGFTPENAGERLTGVGREVFERSVFIRQTNLAVSESRELEQRIASLISSGDEQVSWSQTEGRLREWQRSRRYHKNSQLIELEEEALCLQDRLGQLSELWQEHLLLEEIISDEKAALRRFAARDAQATQAQREEAQLRWAEAAAQLDAAQLQVQSMESQEAAEAQDFSWELEDEIGSIEQDIRRRGRGLLLFSLLGLLLSGILMATTFVPSLDAKLSLPTLCAAISLLGLVVVLANLVRIRTDKRDVAEIEQLQAELKEQQGSLQRRDMAWDAALAREKAAKQLFDVLSNQLGGISLRSPEAVEAEASLMENRQQLARLAGRLQELGDPASLEAELETNRSVQKQLQREYDAITQALSALEDAERELRARFSPKLNDCTAAYFSRLTGGAYEKVTLDRDFSARTEEAGSMALRNAALLSQGTVDQLYLALRLSICDLILPKTRTAPLILDDALAAFDDRRCTLALELLRDLGRERQILLFTCHGREAQLLQHAADVNFQMFTNL